MINIVVATGRNNEIGKSQGLLWKMSSDLKRFKEITTGHPMIMGRKTYDSIGKPLPGRTSIVISREAGHADIKVDDSTALIWVGSLDEALQSAKQLDSEVFVIGGGQIYAQALPYTDRIYWTKVNAAFAEADTFFPEVSGFTEFAPSLTGEEQGLAWEYGVVDKL
jgi:dihydrofolate reductase